MKLTRRSQKEPIRLLARRHNYFPQRFMWRGKQYNVRTVERAWTKIKRNGTRHFFRVRCREGIFDIYQELPLNSWYLAKQVGQ